MNISLSTIQSDVDSSLCQIIVPKAFYENGWFYNFFCRIRYNDEIGVLAFENYDTFMNEGIVLKRYFEYPWREDMNLEEVYGFIISYLKKGYFIMNYLEDFTYHKKEYKPCILFYDFDETCRMLKFFCWRYDNRMETFSMPIERLFFDIQIENVKKEAKFRFDMKRFVEQKNMTYDGCLVKEQFQKGKIGGIKSFYFLKKMNKRQIETSIRTLEEWFDIFRNRLKFLKQKEMDEIYAFIELTEGKTQNDRKKYLRSLIKMYNKLSESFCELMRGE